MSPAIADGKVLFGAKSGTFYAFDYKTEKRKWAFEVGAKQQVTGFIYHRDILLVSTTEGIYALGSDPKKRKLPRDFVLIAEQK